MPLWTCLCRDNIRALRRTDPRMRAPWIECVDFAGSKHRHHEQQLAPTAIVLDAVARCVKICPLAHLQHRLIYQMEVLFPVGEFLSRKLSAGDDPGRMR